MGACGPAFKVAVSVQPARALHSGLPCTVRPTPVSTDLLALVKPAHVIFAVVSGAGFVLRGAWMLLNSERLQARWVRTAPHVVDTLLLVTGVTLAVGLDLSPLLQPWLAAKLLLLVLYIGAGTVALRRGRSLRTRALALVLALIVYALIVLSALTHRALGIP